MSLADWFRRRSRETRAASYGDAVVQALIGAAAGDATGNALRTAALEACAGLWARGLASATVTPDDARTRGLTAAVLAAAGRDLCRAGESVHVLDVRGDRLRLLPVAAFDVTGDADPDSWRYECDLSGPTGTTMRTVPAEGVLHFRYASDPVRPWAGVSPLGWAAATGKLAGGLEHRLGEEAAAIVAHLLPLPIDGADESLARLRSDLAGAKGGHMFVESLAEGLGDGASSAPRRDWVPSRIGADPPAVLDSLRSSAGLAVAAACGVPPVLMSGARRRKLLARELEAIHLRYSRSGGPAARGGAVRQAGNCRAVEL